MRSILLAFAAALGAATLAVSPVAAHDRGEAYHALHEFGYNRIVYQSSYYDHHDKPVYQFKACQGRTEYDIDVNWYGHIIDQRPCGRCYGRDY